MSKSNVIVHIVNPVINVEIDGVIHDNVEIQVFCDEAVDDLKQAIDGMWDWNTKPALPTYVILKNDKVLFRTHCIPSKISTQSGVSYTWVTADE